MPKVTDFVQAAAIRREIERFRESGWRVQKPSELKGTAGGSILYLCHIERRALIAVGLVKEAFVELKRLSDGKKLDFSDVCSAFGDLFDEAAEALPSLSEELQGVLPVAAGLYLSGTRTYALTRTAEHVQYVILRYQDHSSGHALLRPNACFASAPLSPVELEAFANQVLAHDRQAHPERFARAKVIPFRIEKS